MKEQTRKNNSPRTLHLDKLQQLLVVHQVHLENKYYYQFIRNSKVMISP